MVCQKQNYAMELFLLLFYVKLKSELTHLWLIVELLHAIEPRSVQNAANEHIVGAEDALAGLGRVRLTVDLAVLQVDLVGVVGLEVELALALETLEADLVVDVALDGPDALERVHLVAAAEAFVARGAELLRRRQHRRRVAVHLELRQRDGVARRRQAAHVHAAPVALVRVEARVHAKLRRVDHVAVSLRQLGGRWRRRQRRRRSRWRRYFCG